MALNAPALRAHELYRFYHSGDDETLALRGVSLSVEAGETVAVIGPSGSGKSTLLACLAGMDDPDGGTVYVAGERLSRRNERERTALRRRHIGMLFQSANLLDHLTVDQNVRLSEGVARTHDGSRGAELLEGLGLTSKARSYPSQLSGGELVRAGLAVALAPAPTVVLADEPTGEVDSATEQRVLGLLRSVAERGVAIIVVTHNDAVSAFADRVVALLDGRIAA